MFIYKMVKASQNLVFKLPGPLDNEQNGSHLVFWTTGNPNFKKFNIPMRLVFQPPLYMLQEFQSYLLLGKFKNSTFLGFLIYLTSKFDSADLIQCIKLCLSRLNSTLHFVLMQKSRPGFSMKTTGNTVTFCIPDK